MSIDEQLTAIKANDEKVIQQLYANNFDRVKLFVLRNNGTPRDARDIYQEAFLSAWRNIQLDKFTPRQEGALGAYIFQIARYKWLDHLRSLSYKNTVTLKSQHENLMTFEELDDITEKRLQLIKANFRTLGEGCQKLLTRFYYSNESMKTIAADMGWTEATAKNNKYRCMEKLRNLTK